MLGPVGGLGVHHFLGVERLHGAVVARLEYALTEPARFFLLVPLTAGKDGGPIGHAGRYPTVGKPSVGVLSPKARSRPSVDPLSPLRACVARTLRLQSRGLRPGLKHAIVSVARCIEIWE